MNKDGSLPYNKTKKREKKNEEILPGFSGIADHDPDHVFCM